MVCSVLIPAWTAVQGRHKHMCMDRGYLTLGFVDCGRLRLRMDPHKGEVSVDICSMRILNIHQSADTGYLHFLVYVSCLRIPVVSMRRSGGDVASSQRGRRRRRAARAAAAKAAGAAAEPQFTDYVYLENGGCNYSVITV